MNQKRYLQELAYYLRSLPNDVQDQIIDYYRDQFVQAKGEGRSEEDTALLLGRPKANAEKELAIYADQIGRDVDPVNRREPDESAEHYRDEPINYALLIILVVVNVMFVLGPALGFFFAGLGLWFSSVVLMAAPLIAFLLDGSLGFPEFYPVLAMIGLGILLFVAMHYLSKLATRLTRAYFDAMNRMVRGR